ncbi:MAG: hypothetical protein IID39_01935, partial [Planctomycetes bacterium]|nr:hypothetical protein [Planctomycetota bacterium]
NATIRPVQIDFANTGDVATAFSTTGSLLLLSRYANTTSAAFTSALLAGKDQIDNGRIPIFDQSQLAHDPTAPGADPNDPFALYIPWGQLVFDYFTALPLGNEYDPMVPSDMTPTIDQGGLRVHGRIDINSAPWSVLAGLPMIPSDQIPGPFRAKITAMIPTLQVGNATAIDFELAQSIVAYREARLITDAVGNTEDFGANRLRVSTGFLTTGELANVRGLGSSGLAYGIDSDVIDGTANEDYVKAVAVLVALGDWVTTRSHVFTVYGTLRGSGTKSAVDAKAIRFQETVDRLPSFFNKNRLPRRIGPRSVGPYAQASRD